MTDDANIPQWIPGWTLSAPGETLFQETSSPLSVMLGDSPGIIEVSSPDAAFRIALKTGHAARVNLAAYGFRVSHSEVDRDLIGSAVMVDPATLIVEADRLLLQDLVKQPGFTTSIDEAFYFAGDGQHRLGIMVDLKANPSRLVAVAGTGSADIMSSRARGYLHMSAHSIVDTALADTQPRNSRDVPDPIEYIKSRLRPATSHIPFPWLADDDEEPVWRLDLVYPAYMALLLTDPGTAAGLLSNYLDLADENGGIPAAGGNIGPLLHGPASFPALAAMCEACHRATGTLPSGSNDLIDTLSHYLGQIDTTSPLFATECQCLQRIAKISGRSVSIPRAHDDAHEQTAPPLSDAAAEILLSQRSLSAQDSALRDAARRLVGTDRDVMPASLLAVARHLAVVDYRAYSDWTSELASHAEDRWAALWTGASSSAERLSVGGLLVCARDAQRGSFNRVRLREQRIYRFAARNRRAIIAATAVCAIAFAAFVISVLMRSTMPPSVYETKLGMLDQHYRSGEYAAALEALDAIEKRGKSEDIRIRFYRGKVLYRLGDYDGAAEAFRYCTERKPDYPSAHYNLALCEYRAGRFKEAEERFNLIMGQFRTTYPTLASYASRAAAIAREAAGE